MEISGSWDLSHPSNVAIDYLIYEATVNSTISQSPTGNQTSFIFVDDTSPYLEYNQGGWEPNPAVHIDLLHNSGIFNASVTQPLSPNSTVSLDFTGLSTTNSVRVNGPQILYDFQAYLQSSRRVPSLPHPQTLRASDGSPSTMV